MRWLAIGFMLATIATVSGCNTVEGLGRDVEAAGAKVSDTAEDVKN
jgi:predicted small secreted protein